MTPGTNPSTEQKSNVIEYDFCGARPRGLIARTDPVLFQMSQLVDAIIESGDIHPAVRALHAFYGEHASRQARKIECMSALPIVARRVRIEVERLYRLRQIEAYQQDIYPWDPEITMHLPEATI